MWLLCDGFNNPSNGSIRCGGGVAFIGCGGGDLAFICGCGDLAFIGGGGDVVFIGMLFRRFSARP